MTSFLYYEISLDGALAYDKIIEAHPIDVAGTTLHACKECVRAWHIGY